MSNFSETRKIIENTTWMIFDRVFMLALNLLVTVKIANHYGASGYGTYQYAVSIVALFEILVTLVNSRVVKKFYIDNDPDEVVFAATVSRLLFSSISAIIGIAFIIVYNSDIDFSIMFAILLLNAIIGNLKFGMSNRFEYLLKSRKIVIASNISAVIGSILQLIAVKMNWTIIAISVIAVVNSIINVSIITVQYKMEFKNVKKVTVNKRILKLMISESLPLAVAASCATIYTKCDSVMIGMMLSTTEVGIYSISVKLIGIVEMAINPIGDSIYPKLISLYKTDKIAYEKLYIKVSSLMTWINIFGVLMSFVILPYCFKFLNNEYMSAYPIYCIYVIGTFFEYNSTLRAGHFTLINHGSILMYSQIVCVIVNVVLNVLFIRQWGMYGAAFATVITQAASLMFSNLFFGKDGIEVFKWQIRALNPVNILGSS